jgi:peptidoglycan/LPS O-acetylase OafA/YrhL
MRFARIAPCLIGILIILATLDLMGVNGFIIATTTLPHAISAALTFHINWLEAKTGYLPGGWDILWSLSIEETFYIFFPLLCLLIRKEWMLKLALCVFIILAPFARSHFYINNDIWSDHSYLSCMDGIAIGCLAAIYKNKIKMSLNLSRFLLMLGLAFFCFLFFFRPQAYQLGLSRIGLNVTILEIGIGLILMTAKNETMSSRHSFLSSQLQWFGRNSYEVYLTHMFVVTFLAQLFYNLKISINMMVLWYRIILVFSGIIGNLVVIYFSEPFNKYLRRIPRKTSDLQYAND